MQRGWIVLTAVILLAVFHTPAISADNNIEAASDAVVRSTSEVELEKARAEKERAEMANTFRQASIENIIALIDSGQNAQAEGRLITHLQRYPDDAQAYGQQSRLDMRSGSVTDDSLLGFRFSEEADAKATASLEMSLRLSPDNAEEQSRLGYLHAVQGRYDDAEAAFEIARAATPLPPWLRYNEAIAYAGRGEYSQATTSLELVTSQRPARGDTVKWNIYRSAWTLRTAMARLQPSTDPVEAVRKGLVKRILIDDVYATALASLDSDKPLMIMLNSSDQGCGYCRDSLPKLAAFIEAMGDDFQFVYASVEPWNDINKHPVVRSALSLTGVPNTVVVSRGKHIFTAKGSIDLIEVDGYRSLSKRLQNGDTQGKPLRSFDSEMRQHIERSLDTLLSEREGIRAAAFVQDGSYWLSGIVDNQETQAIADAMALKECMTKKQSSLVNGECRLHNPL